MFKGLVPLVPGTELNLTIAHQQSATNRSGSVHRGRDSHYRKCHYGNIKTVLP